MALKGNHNHYNVKFLKGYGFSISVKDSKIILEDYMLYCKKRFKKSGIVLRFVSIEKFRIKDIDA